MPEEHYDSEFPNLRTAGWTRTSEPAKYNCIAFVVGDTSRFWWPNLNLSEPDVDYWPDGVPHLESLDAFVLVFATEGFNVCETADLEEGFEKIALYALDRIVRHAAIQQPNGRWRSKLGPHEDIETTLEGLVGPSYGNVAAFLKRPIR